LATATASLLVLLVLAEIALRVVDPPILRFAYAMRQAFGYAGWTHIDLRAGQDVELHLPRYDGEDLFRFRLASDPRGLRMPAPPGTGTAVHCIGDSLTMGWGVENEETFPAALGRVLGAGHRVANVGCTAYGLIAAMEKSRRVRDELPPAAIVYLFCPNDFDDDAVTATVRRRGPARHAIARVMAVLKRHSYAMNVTYALQSRGYWRAARAGEVNQFFALDEYRDLAPADLDRLAEAAGLPANETTVALERLRQSCLAQGVPLLVVVSDAAPASLAMLRFCRTNGIPCAPCPIGADLRIAGDGHFTPEGNRVLAEAVATKLRTALPGAR
jgi:lysophospholipase L1-like esterase